jgi:hypothetical protein
MLREKISSNSVSSSFFKLQFSLHKKLILKLINTKRRRALPSQGFLTLPIELLHEINLAYGEKKKLSLYKKRDSIFSQLTICFIEAESISVQCLVSVEILTSFESKELVLSGLSI